MTVDKILRKGNKKAFGKKEGKGLFRIFSVRNYGNKTRVTTVIDHAKTISIFVGSRYYLLKDKMAEFKPDGRPS